MKKLRYIAFIACLTAWVWWGWHYGWPLAAFYFDLLAERQGLLGAKVSWFMSLLVVLWVYYAAAMNLGRVIEDGTAPLAMKVLGYGLVLPPALFLDWLANMLLTVFMLDWPAQPWELVTGRLERYINGERGRARQLVAIFFETILGALDRRGYHVKRKPPPILQGETNG